MTGVSRPRVSNSSPRERIRDFLAVNGFVADAAEGVRMRAKGGGGKREFREAELTAIRSLTRDERIEQSLGETHACVVTLGGTKEYVLRVVESKFLGFIPRRSIRVDEFKPVRELGMQPSGPVSRPSGQPSEPHAALANPPTMRFAYDLPDRGISRPVQH